MQTQRVFLHFRGFSSFLAGTLFLVALSTISVAQEEKGAKAESISAMALRELKTDLDIIVGDPNFRNAIVGANVVSLQKNEPLYQYNESKSLVPASNLKLITTAAALEYLGSDFTYTTTVFLDGTIRRGEFSGNVFVRGAGDPSMSTFYMDNPVEILERWAEVFDSLGIRTIRGNIIGDDSYFDDKTWGPGWAWDDILYPFSAQVSALSFNDNKIDFTIRPGRSAGEPAIVTMYPDNAYMTVINNVLTVAPGEPTSIHPLREAYSNVIELTGTIELDTTGRAHPIVQPVTVDDPTQFMMGLFKQTLEDRGIRVQGGVFDIAEWDDVVKYTELRPICYYTSPPLRQIIRTVNITSHNLAAEMVLKTIAKEVTGIGSFEKGTEVLRNYAAQYGISQESVSIVDGSGLSRLNLLTPRQITLLLGAMYRSRYRNDYIASLAVPGQPGTLASRMKGSRAEQNVFAKTGSLENVCSLSGYVFSRDKEPLAFSIILNNFTVPQSLARNLQDLFIMRLASFSRKQ
jgi:D-alanyl-D-alanine carboxypeptidase/D-alanyl-D-alanine-endopeptidase (penicillin-binding protein 4)